MAMIAGNLEEKKIEFIVLTSPYEENPTLPGITSPEGMGLSWLRFLKVTPSLIRP
jgi:hypothetical protein